MKKSDYKNMWVYIEHDGLTAAPVGLSCAVKCASCATPRATGFLP